MSTTKSRTAGAAAAAGPDASPLSPPSGEAAAAGGAPAASGRPNSIAALMRAKAERTAAQRAARELMALRLPGLLAEHGSMSAVARFVGCGEEWLRACRDGRTSERTAAQPRAEREAAQREARRVLAGRLPGLLAQYSTVSGMCKVEKLNRRRVIDTAAEFGVPLVPGRKYVPHPPPKPKPRAKPAAENRQKIAGELRATPPPPTRPASGFVVVTAGIEQRQARALAMFQRNRAADPAEIAQAAGVPLHVAYRLRRIALGGLDA